MDNSYIFRNLVEFFVGSVLMWKPMIDLCIVSDNTLASQSQGSLSINVQVQRSLRLPGDLRSHRTIKLVLSGEV